MAVRGDFEARTTQKGHAAAMKRNGSKLRKGSRQERKKDLMAIRSK